MSVYIIYEYKWTLSNYVPIQFTSFAHCKFRWEIHHKHFPWHHSMPPEKAVKLLSGFSLWHNQRTPHKNQTQTKRSPNAASSGSGSSSVGNGVGVCVHSKLMTDKAFCIIFNFIFTMRSSCSTPSPPSPSSPWWDSIWSDGGLRAPAVH